jgi:hypothetical protein
MNEDIDVRYYHYGFRPLFQRGASWSAVLFLIIITGAAALQKPDTLICMVPLILWSVPICLFNAYMYPRIGVCDTGVLISFLFRDLMIPWEDIVDVRRVWFLPRTLVVRARKITPFHVAYGIIYSNSLLPSFLISSSIDDYYELAGKIRQRIQNWDA